MTNSNLYNKFFNFKDMNSRIAELKSIIIRTLESITLSNDQKKTIHEIILSASSRLRLKEGIDYVIKNIKDDDYVDLTFDIDRLDEQALFDIYDCIE